jgi:hypothetical protein
MNLMPRCFVLRPIIMAALIAALLIVSLPLRAYAHDGPPRLELSMNRASPGAMIEVRGINLAPKASIVIVLVHNESEMQLGQVMSDAQGDFIQALALPVDLTAGDYTVRAVSQDQALVSTALKIEGAAMVEGGETRDESEPLLSAMPSNRSIAASAPSKTVTAPQAAVIGESSAAWLVLPLGTLAVAGIALALRRRSVQ